MGWFADAPSSPMRIRGYATEFGLVAAKGLEKIEPLLVRAQAADLPALVGGAMSVIRQARQGKGHRSPWLAGLLQRKPPKVAAVALANKMARVAWKMMATGECYDAGRSSLEPKTA